MSAEWPGSQSGTKNMPTMGIFFFFFVQLRYVISFLTSLHHAVRWNAHRAEDRNNILLCRPSKGSWNSINVTDSISCELDAATLPPKQFGCLPGKVCVVTSRLFWTGSVLERGNFLHTHDSVRAIVSRCKVDAVSVVVVEWMSVGLKCIFSGLCNLVYCTVRGRDTDFKENIWG